MERGLELSSDNLNQECTVKSNILFGDLTGPKQTDDTLHLGRVPVNNGVKTEHGSI